MAKLCYYAVLRHKNSHARNVAKGRIKDVDELHLCILTAWDELDHCVIDTAVTQWRTRLYAYDKVKDGHFEHKLSQ